jgi:predicted nucleic acid-binding protein
LTLLIDAAPVVALADSDEPRREQILEILTSEPGVLVIPAPTTAEIDYLLGQRYGQPARRAFLGDLAVGRFAVASLERDDYATVVGLETRYADLHLGLADCALVVLADRYRTDRILSFDERHFRSVVSLGGAPFVVLPYDAATGQTPGDPAHGA